MRMKPAAAGAATHGQKDKKNKGRYGKRLGGVVKRAIKASKNPDATFGNRKKRQ